MQVQICTQQQVLNKDGKYGVNKLATIPDPEAPHGTLKVRVAIMIRSFRMQIVSLLIQCLFPNQGGLRSEGAADPMPTHVRRTGMRFSAFVRLSFGVSG